MTLVQWLVIVCIFYGSSGVVEAVIIHLMR